MQNIRQLAIKKLQSADIRPSEPRICIYEYLERHRIHPGAEEIYKAMLPDHPTLSLTTVYNTLKLFAEHGLVQVLTIESGELRYDIRTDFHAHFQCRGCGCVSDLDLKIPEVQPDSGYLVERHCLDFYGLCPSCNS